MVHDLHIENAVDDEHDENANQENIMDEISVHEIHEDAEADTNMVDSVITIDENEIEKMQETFKAICCETRRENDATGYIARLNDEQLSAFHKINHQSSRKIILLGKAGTGN